MNKKLKNILGIIVPIILGLFLVYYTYNSFTSEQIDKMKSYFVHANYFYVFLSAILAFIGYVLRAYRWRYTLEYIGYPSDFKFNLVAVSIGYFLNLTIPVRAKFQEQHC